MASNWALHFATNITDPTQRHNPQFQSWGLAEGCAVILLLLSLKGMKRVTDSRTLASQLGLQLLTSHQLPSGCQLLTGWLIRWWEPKEPGPTRYFPLKTSCNAAEMQACGIKQTVKQKMDTLSLSQNGRAEKSPVAFHKSFHVISPVLLWCFCFKENKGDVEFCFFLSLVLISTSGQWPNQSLISLTEGCLTTTCMFQLSFTGNNYLLSKYFYSVIIKIQIVA